MDTYFPFKSALQNLSKKKGVETQNNQFQARIAPNKAVGMHEDTAWHVSMGKVTPFPDLQAPTASEYQYWCIFPVSSKSCFPFKKKKMFEKASKVVIWVTEKKIWILDPRFLLQICTWNLCNFRELCITKSTPEARKFLPGGEKL